MRNVSVSAAKPGGGHCRSNAEMHMYQLHTVLPLGECGHMFHQMLFLCSLVIFKLE